MMKAVSNKRSAAALFGGIGITLAMLAATVSLCAAVSGCAYKGGKVVDGTSLAIGMTIPGTEWTINALDYVGGLRVAGNDQTSICVSNEVIETNSYFGVVETRRHSRMTATIEPTETSSEANAAANSN